MHQITSINNQQVKSWKRLHRRKERQKTNTYLLEGFHLVEEALQFEKQQIINIMIREDILKRPETQKIIAQAKEDQLIQITEHIAEDISHTETNQGIFAIMKIKASSFPKELKRPFLLLDAVQDPGNVGTMIRTADAAGFQGVFFGKGTVDLYNDKTLRAAQGSHFHLEMHEGDLEDFISYLKERNIPILGTTLDKDAISYKEIKTPSAFGLLVGNEGAGVDHHLLDLVDQTLYIPMKGQAESLNVAIASSIIMFHLS